MTQHYEEDQSIDLVNQDLYWLDKEQDLYKFDFTSVPTIRQVLSIPGIMVRKITALYSNKTGKGRWTVRDVANYFETDEVLIKSILYALGMTHGDVVSHAQLQQMISECVDEDEIDTMAEDIANEAQLLARAKRAVNAASVRALEDKAMKWELMQMNLIDPWTEAVAKIQPVGHKPVKRKVIENEEDLPTAVICLSDIHYGDALKEGMVFNGKPFDLCTVEERVEAYAEYVVDLVAQGIFNTREAHIFCLGDIIDSLSGFTDKSTKLGDGNGIIRGTELFVRAQNSIYKFLARLTDAFDNLHVHAVGGNHDSKADYLCIWGATNTLIQQGRLKPENVHVFNERFGSVIVNGTYIMFEHGYSADYRNRRPSSRQRSNVVKYVSDYMLNDPKATTGQHPRIFLCGDNHCEEHIEYKSFTLVQSSALVNANHYSAECAYDVKPSQTVIGVTPKGVNCRYAFRPDDFYDDL